MAAARARRRRKPPRKLSRAQRLALSPRPPAGAILAGRIAAARIANAFEASIRKALAGKLDTFALRRSDATEEASEAALDAVSFKPATYYPSTGGVAAKSLKHSEAEFKRVGIKVEKEPDTAKVLTAWRKKSAKRAASILEREKATIIELLAGSENRTPEQLQERLEERFVVTKSKLEAASKDDILTLNGQITQVRQEAAGIEEFYWTTAGENRVRESHAEIDGEVFRWDDPPIVDGEEAIPGQPPNCRCVATPRLPELE